MNGEHYMTLLDNFMFPICQCSTYEEQHFMWDTAPQHFALPVPCVNWQLCLLVGGMGVEGLLVGGLGVEGLLVGGFGVEDKQNCSRVDFLFIECGQTFSLQAKPKTI